MGDCIEVMPMKAVRNLLYDEDGRVVGVWYTDTSRGMFYDCFISRMEPERTCSNRHKKFGRARGEGGIGWVVLHACSAHARNRRR